MKIFISLDMEGIAGTFNWKQEENQDRALVRKWMTQQVEWILEGIKQSTKNSEVNQIILADSHNMGDNLSYDITEIDDRIQLISGSPRPDFMMSTIHELADVVFFAGYHASAGTMYGNMDHTYSSSCVHNVWINDRKMNEAFINAALAGYYSIPVGLIIGDQALKDQVHTEVGMPWVEYVVTKEALFRFAAKFRPMEIVREETQVAVQKVLDSNLKNIPLYRFQPPIELKVEFQSSEQADSASLMPYTKRLDGRTISFEADDYRCVYRAFIALAMLARKG